MRESDRLWSRRHFLLTNVRAATGLVVAATVGEEVVDYLARLMPRRLVPGFTPPAGVRLSHWKEVRFTVSAEELASIRGAVPFLKDTKTIMAPSAVPYTVQGGERFSQMLTEAGRALDEIMARQCGRFASDTVLHSEYDAYADAVQVTLSRVGGTDHGWAVSDHALRQFQRESATRIAGSSDNVVGSIIIPHETLGPHTRDGVVRNSPLPYPDYFPPTND